MMTITSSFQQQFSALFSGKQVLEKTIGIAILLLLMAQVLSTPVSTACGV